MVGMVSLPDGWSITEATESFDPDIVSVSGVPVAEIRFDVRGYGARNVSGDWSWRALPGAGPVAAWWSSKHPDYEGAVADVVKHLSGHV